MKSRKLLRYILLVAVVALVFFFIGKKKGWIGSDYRIQVATEKGASRDIVEIITANGRIQPETEVIISPDVSGEIVELNVKEGDHVEKGDFLLKIKPDNYISIRNRAEATLNSTKARLTQAEAQLEQAHLEYDRKKKLWGQQAIPEAEFEQATTTFHSNMAEKEAAEFSVASAEASLREAEENLRKTSIYAPMSGTISMLLVELGERVVGTELMTGTEIMRIANLNRMEVEVEVNENDIVRVKHLDTALIEVDAYLGQEFKAIVTEIPVSAATTGVTTDQVTNFNVKILLLPESYQSLINEGNLIPFRPGMSATADIQTSRKSNVFTVPIQAVTTRPDTSVQKTEQQHDGDEEEENMRNEDLIVVFVVRNDTAFLQEVKTGIQDDRFIEITEGLSQEEEIVAAPYSAISKKLADKSPVEVVKKEDLFKVDDK